MERAPKRCAPGEGASAAACEGAVAAPNTDGLLLCAFYVAARGFTTEAARLLPTCRELGEDEGEESLLRGLIAGEMKVERGGGAVGRPRLHAAARVGSARRVAALVRVGARVGAVNEEGLTALMVAASWGREGVMRELLGTAGVDVAFVGARIAEGKVNAGHSAFSLACYWARDMARKLSESERAAAAACARALAASPLMGPGDLGGGDGSALYWACDAGLEDVVRSWLGDPRCSAAIVAQRVTGGHSAFSIACQWARDMSRKLSEGERAAVAACARALAASPLMGPGDLGGSDGTALYWACDAGLEDVVRSWLGDTRCTAAIVAQRNTFGYSAFSAACEWARDMERELSEDERAAAAACVRTLAASPLMGPGDLGGGDRTALYWACEACLEDVVRSWLGDPRCSAAIVAQRDGDGHSAFSLACLWARDISPRLSEGERAAAAACARALAASPLMGPGDLGWADGTALYWACEARLEDVVRSWLGDTRCTAAIVAQRNASGHSAFSVACYGAFNADLLTEGERTASVACATLLATRHQPGDEVSRGAGSSALLWACRARLSHLVAAWVASPSCTRYVLTQCSSNGESPFSAACSGARDASRHLSPTERAAAAQCARAIAASPHMRPGDLGEHGGTALMWASWAGLHDVVTTLLASPHCTRTVETALSTGGESAFSAACRWAGDSERVLSVTERTDAAKCVKALAASPHLRPGDTSHGGRTALASACGAGLVDIVSAMLADARRTHAVVNKCDMNGRTAASALLKRCGAAATLTAEERHVTAACARALGGSEHVPKLVRERLEAAAVACEGNA